MSNNNFQDVEISGSTQFRSSYVPSHIGQVALIPYPGIMNLHPQMLQHHLIGNYLPGQQNRSVHYKSNLCSPLSSQPATIAIKAEKENNSRILAMGTTIKHLRVLLQNELKSKLKESDVLDSLKAELKELKEENLILETKLTHLQEEKSKEVSCLNVQCETLVKEANSQLRSVIEELQEKPELLENLQQENEKLMQDFEQSVEVKNNLAALINELRSKEEDLQKQVDQLGKENSSLENCLIEAKFSLVAKEKQLREQGGVQRMELEALKNELDHIKALKESGDKLFQDLAKKHVFMIEHAGEQMYDDYVRQHSAFLRKLETNAKANSSVSGEGIVRTAECIQHQLALINECRVTFKEGVERVMRRIERGTALVSDLNFRAPSPAFEISVDNFENMLEVLIR